MTPIYVLEPARARELSWYAHRVGCSRGPPKTEKGIFIVSQRARCDIVVTHSLLCQKSPRKVREKSQEEVSNVVEC